MTEAVVYGAIVAVPLVGGALVALVHEPSPRLLAVVLAFASGAMMSALAFELVQEADHWADTAVIALGLFGGALTYLVLDTVVERSLGTAGVGLLLGVLLDGIPENIALGGTLAVGGEAGGLALAAAIFAGNFPEALGGAAEMLRTEPRRRVLGIWFVTALATGVMVPLGFLLLDDVSGAVRGLTLAFAGGAVTAVLASTIMPEAYREGGRWVALATVAGFLTAYLLSR
jgi:ZIP family zinc transporter